MWLVQCVVELVRALEEHWPADLRPVGVRDVMAPLGEVGGEVRPPVEGRVSELDRGQVRGVRGHDGDEVAGVVGVGD